MDLEPSACYRALRSRDPRFDGVFFVGISTTAIYCRPVCPARPALEKHCTFFSSAAAAEREGYRPCLRCRPELAPGNARVDAVGRLAAAAAARIEEGALGSGGVDALARSLGITDRHLRRVVQAEFGVAPIELAQTHRLLLAKRLLTDTALPLTQVALSSGFRSVRRFNALFRSRYRLKPRDIRRRGAPSPVLACELAYRPPMDWAFLIGFLGKRAITGVEAVSGDVYRRTVSLSGRRGWIAVTHLPRRRTLRVELPASLAPVLPAVLARVKHLFDLSADPRAIAAHLGALARPGLRVPGAFDGFEAAARAILGQQVSVRAAATFASRIAGAFGEALPTPHTGLTHAFPDARRIAALRPAGLCALGLVSARARCLIALARAGLTLEPGADVAAVKARLLRIPGIGPWTAEYIAMRALAWPDAFPHTDLGVYKALKTRDPRKTLALAEAWRPFRAYATMALWSSLEES